MQTVDKPRANWNGWVWKLTPPASRPGHHILYIYRTLKEAYGHWDEEAQSIERFVREESRALVRAEVEITQ